MSSLFTDSATAEPWFFEPLDGIAREHSRKPEEFYNLVAKHTSGLRRADVFSRQRRPGWDTFGDEADRFEAAT